MELEVPWTTGVGPNRCGWITPSARKSPSSSGDPWNVTGKILPGKPDRAASFTHVITYRSVTEPPGYAAPKKRPVEIRD